MKRTLILAAGLLALAAASVPASAMPALGNLAPSAVADAQPLVKVHGLHGVCRLGPFGWHRSYRWGRVSCLPRPLRHRHRYHRH